VAAVRVETPEAESLPAESACVFTLAGESCAIHVRQARAVVKLGPVSRKPGAPPAVVGVTNVRGTVVPVLDLRPLLGVPPASVGAGSMAVILEHGDLRAALAVDRVIGLERFAAALPAPEAGRLVSLACGTLPSAVTLLDGPTILAAVRREWAPEESVA